MRGFGLVFAGLSICLMAVAVSRANAENGGGRKSAWRVGGIVQDTLGRSISAANISLLMPDGGVAAKTRTDANGKFEFDAVIPGNYAVLAKKAGFKPATSIISVPVSAAKPLRLTMQSETALSLEVSAKRIRPARNSLPSSGASEYRFTQKSLRQLPQGDNTPLNDVLLQAPGVVQDSYGQVHIRGDHANLQYRINGVQLPEGVSGFGQILTPRFARSINLLTGAMPAEYGLRTAGIVDIQTKNGLSLNGGDLDVYGGQRGTVQPGFQLGGAKGSFNYFVTGQYLRDDRGIEPPTPGPTAIHDHTEQGQGFGYFSYFLGPTSKLSLISGTAVNYFEIPANPGQPQIFKLDGIGVYPSADISETQFEQNYFGVLAFQSAIGSRFHYQVAGFSRYSTISFTPDDAGDLIYNGIASQVFRSGWANGVQIDAAWRWLATHTLGWGLYFDAERAEIDNHSLVFPAANGVQTSTAPFGVVDNKGLQVWEYSTYVQDQWRPLASLTINYGARFDLYDGIVRADQASPRVGLVYTPLDGTTLHAGYARYFTPPPTELVAVTDIRKFSGTTGAPPSAGDGNPAPERDHYFDVGATQRVINGLTVGVDSYYKKAADLLDEGQFGAALIYSPFNYAKGRVYGAEFTTSYARKNLTAYFNFAWSVAQGTEIESGQFNFTHDELAYIADHYVFLDHDQTFTASAGGAYHWRGFNFLLNGIYGSGLRRGFANTGNLPFYVQINAGITKALDIPGFAPMEARASVVNLLDWIYPIRNGTGIGVFAAQYGPRRAFYAGLKWDLPFLKTLNNRAP